MHKLRSSDTHVLHVRTTHAHTLAFNANTPIYNLTHLHKYTHSHTYEQTCAHAHTHTHTHTHIHLNTQAHVHACKRISTPTQSHMTYINTHADRCT